MKVKDGSLRNTNNRAAVELLTVQVRTQVILVTPGVKLQPDDKQRFIDLSGRVRRGSCGHSPLIKGSHAK